VIAPDVASGERDHRRFSRAQSGTGAAGSDGRRSDLIRIPGERSILARFSDPDTSHDAGNSQTEAMLNARQTAILEALSRYGAMTDEQTLDRIDAMRVMDASIPNSTAQAFRTARSVLATSGDVVDTGERARTRTGRTAIVWAVATRQGRAS